MGNKWNKYLNLYHHQNLATMARHSMKLYADKRAMRWFSHDLSTVHMMTYRELEEQMRVIFGGLHALGLRKGDRIALCSETAYFWVCCDLGVQALGGVLTAIYANLKPAEVRYILNDSGARAIIVDTQDNLEKVQSIEKECGKLEFIICVEEFKKELKRANVFSLEEIRERGKEYLKDKPTLFDDSIAAIKEDDTASLIYTSGTTGVPKGTILTNKNFLSDATAAVAVAATLKRHVIPSEMDFFCLLPLAHSFGRCVDEYCCLYIGAGMNFVGGYDPPRVRKAFMAYQPTLMCAIPYFYQKIYNIVMDEVASMPPKIQKVFKKAVDN